jgi:DNA mismatch endonuclease (patch repair protein)
MRAIRGRDTKPERLVRSIAHRLGYRFTVQGRGLPGRPDLVFSRRRKAVFVHGCFWHGHAGCRFAYQPKTRAEWWRAKIQATKARDHAAIIALQEAGWHAFIVWECECSDAANVAESLRRFLGRRAWTD